MRSSGLSLDQAPPEDIPFRFFLTAPVFGLLGRKSDTIPGSFSFQQ